MEGIHAIVRSLRKRDMEPSKEENRGIAPPWKGQPAGVAILVILVIIGAIGAFAFGFFIWWVFIDGVPSANLLPIAAVSIVLGIFISAVAFGLPEQTPRGWWLALIASVILLVSTVIQRAAMSRFAFIHDPSALGALAQGLPIALIVIALIILGALFVVRGYFRIGAKAVA